MEPPQNELELIINKHKCMYCDKRRLRSLEELRRGAESGCPLFSIGIAVVDWAVSSEGLLGHARDEIRQVSLDTSKSQISFQVYDYTRGLSGRYEVKEKKVFWKIEERIAYPPAAGTDSVFHHQFYDLSNLPISTRSEATFDVIKAWNEDCARTHNCYRRPALTSSQIALQNVRFLEIQDESLLLREELVPERYACLSHCWGSGQEIYKTRDDNISVHLTSGILIELLPRTYRDAVEICQRLNIRYLWIDSLCIVQNCAQDWNDQASRMADIYENSYITIAATRSENPSQGCFIENSFSYIGVPLPGHHDIYIRKIPELWVYSSKASQWPLLTRAWVFQELSLSPRTIHFGPKETIWHCRYKWELQQAVTIDKTPSSKRLRKGLKGLWVPKFAKDENTNLTYFWHDIITRYSKMKLTFQEDRVPAIAAMASRVREMKSNDRYLAGLWESTLIQDLLWCTTGDFHLRLPDHIIEKRMAAIEKQAGRLPTWSWASVQESVSWPSEGNEILTGARIIEVKCATRGADILGKMTEGKIIIEAPMCNLTSVANLPNSWYWYGLAKSSEAAQNTLDKDELAVHDLYWDDGGSRDEMPTFCDIHVMFLLKPSTYLTYSQANARALLLKETAVKGHWIRMGICTANLVDYVHYMRSRIDFHNKPRATTEETEPVYQECGTSLVSKLEAIPRQKITLV